MKIYDTTDPMTILWELFKDLGIPVYKNINDVSDDDNICVVIRSDVTNNAGVYGDGHVLTRRSACDVNLLARTKSPHADSDFAVNCKKISDILDAEEINYSKYDLGYNDSLKASEYNWSMTINYG